MLSRRFAFFSFLRHFHIPLAVHPFSHLLKWKVCLCQMGVQSDEPVPQLDGNWLQRPFVALISVQSKCGSVLLEREHFLAWCLFCSALRVSKHEHFADSGAH